MKTLTIASGLLHADYDSENPGVYPVSLMSNCGTGPVWLTVDDIRELIAWLKTAESIHMDNRGDNL